MLLPAASFWKPLLLRSRPVIFDEIVPNPKITLATAEAYLEPCKKPIKERFCENSYRLLAVNYFPKNSPS